MRADAVRLARDGLAESDGTPCEAPQSQEVSVNNRRQGSRHGLVGRHGRLRVARDEWVDKDLRVAVGQLDRRLAEEADLHLVSPPFA